MCIYICIYIYIHKYIYIYIYICIHIYTYIYVFPFLFPGMSTMDHVYSHDETPVLLSCIQTEKIRIIIIGLFCKRAL